MQSHVSARMHGSRYMVRRSCPASWRAKEVDRQGSCYAIVRSCFTVLGRMTVFPTPCRSDRGMRPREAVFA